MQVIERFTLCERNLDVGTGVLAPTASQPARVLTVLKSRPSTLSSPGRYRSVSAGTGWDDQFTLYLLDKEGALRSTQSRAEGWMSSGVPGDCLRRRRAGLRMLPDQRLRLSIAPTPHWRALAPAPCATGARSAVITCRWEIPSSWAMSDTRNAELEAALHDFEATASSFAARLIRMSEVSDVRAADSRDEPGHSRGGRGGRTVARERRRDGARNAQRNPSHGPQP